MNKNARIYVAGHLGLVGSALVRNLEAQGYTNIIKRTKTDLDLRRQDSVEKFFREQRPEYVFFAAAKVGGILANATYKADFIYDNVTIASNVLKTSALTGVKKLLNLGSSCIYPKLAPQPLKEEYLLTGPLEPTNESYAIAKITAIKMCRYFNEQYGTNFLSVMPTNLYGPNDNFDLETSHALPALIHKIHAAAQKGEDVVMLWGDGTPEREFLYSDDLANASIFIMNHYDHTDIGELINIGTGKDISIKDLAALVSELVGYNGQIRWDTSKPNGTPKKLLDVSKINNLNWKAKTKLREGISATYEWFKAYCELA